MLSLEKNFKWYDGIIKEDHMDYDPNDIWNKKKIVNRHQT